MENRDIAERLVTIRVRHIWYVVMTVVGLAVAASSGYYTLRAEVLAAKFAGESLERRVATIECLVRQQTNYQIYGITPRGDCARAHR